MIRHSHSDNYFKLKELMTFQNSYVERVDYLFSFEEHKRAKVLAILLAHAELATPFLDRDTVSRLLNGELIWPKVDGSFENLQAEISLEKLQSLGLISFYAGYCKVHCSYLRAVSHLHETVWPLYQGLKNLRNIVYGINGFVRPHYSIEKNRAIECIKDYADFSYVESLSEITNESDVYHVKLEGAPIVKLISMYLWMELNRIYDATVAFNKWLQIATVESECTFFLHPEGISEELRKNLHDQLIRLIESDPELDQSFSTVIRRWQCESSFDMLLVSQSARIEMKVNSTNGTVTNETSYSEPVSASLEEIEMRLMVHEPQFTSILDLASWWNFRAQRHDYSHGQFCFYDGMIQQILDFDIHVSNISLHMYGRTERLLLSSQHKPELRHCLVNLIPSHKQSIDYLLYLLSRKETASVALYSIVHNVSSISQAHGLIDNSINSLHHYYLNIACDEYFSILFSGDEKETAEDVVQLLIVLAKESIHHRAAVNAYIIKNCLDNILKKFDMRQMELIAELLLLKVMQDKSEQENNLPAWKFHLLFWLLEKSQDIGILSDADIESRIQIAIVNIYKDKFYATIDTQPYCFDVCEYFETLPWQRIRNVDVIECFLMIIKDPEDWIPKLSFINEEKHGNNTRLLRNYFHLLLCLLLANKNTDVAIKVISKIVDLIENLGLPVTDDQGETKSDSLFQYEDYIESYYRLWDKFSTTVDYFDDESFTRLLNVLKKYEISKVLDIYNYVNKESRRMQIQALVINMSDESLDPYGIATLNKIFVMAWNNDQVLLANKALEAGEIIIENRFSKMEDKSYVMNWINAWKEYGYLISSGYIPRRLRRNMTG